MRLPPRLPGVAGRGFLVLILYHWRPDSDSHYLSRDKKLYFGDPLLERIAREQAPGPARNVPALLENAFALALYRRYGPVEHQAEGFILSSTRTAARPPQLVGTAYTGRRLRRRGL